MITGLRNLTPADLEEVGRSAGANVSYGKGSQGGATVEGDVKAEQVKLGNEVLAKCGGNIEVAREMMKEITKGDKPGKDGRTFPGFDTASRLTKSWQIKKAFEKLDKIPDPEPGEKKEDWIDA